MLTNLFRSRKIAPRHRLPLRLEFLDDRIVPATIAGEVFTDLFGEGARDAQDSGRNGVTVFLDTDNDGALDAGETTTTTATIGG